MTDQPTPNDETTDLAYGDASAYLEVPAGEYDFEVRAAGTSVFEEPAYRTGALTLSEGALEADVVVNVAGPHSAIVNRRAGVG